MHYNASSSTVETNANLGCSKQLAHVDPRYIYGHGQRRAEEGGRNICPETMYPEIIRPGEYLPPEIIRPENMRPREYVSQEMFHQQRFFARSMIFSQNKNTFIYKILHNS